MNGVFRTGCYLGIVLMLVAAAVQAQPGASGDETHPVVLVRTSAGPIVIRLDAEHAPVTVENFLAYVEAGFYNNTLIHRVVPGFVIQGGGYEAGTFIQKPTRPPISNESNNGLKNTRGTISMARRSDPNSATSQFFINLVDNDSLDSNRYAVFGEVIMGMETVDKIAAMPTGNRGSMTDVPVEDVIVESIVLNE